MLKLILCSIFMYKSGHLLSHLFSSYLCLVVIITLWLMTNIRRSRASSENGEYWRLHLNDDGIGRH